MSEPDVTGSAEALLMEAFGLPLLSYLCAVDEAAMRDRLEGADDLPASADSVLFGQLLPLAQRVARERAEHRGLPAAFALRLLGERTETSPWGIGNLMRLAAGGAIPQELITDVVNDPVKKALAHMALDAYPVLLAPDDSDWEMPALSMFRHPKRVDLSSALETDSDLSRLYPEEDPGLGRRGFVYTSLGRGGTCQSVMFGETVIQAAWYSVTIRTARPTPQDLVETVLRFVDLLREAAAGGRPTVQSLIVFTGFITADGKVVETPWGTLRPLTDLERAAAPRSLEGAVSGTDADGRHVTVSYAGEMVLETSLPYAIAVEESPEPEGAHRPWPTLEGADALRRRQQGVRLTALLAIDRPSGSWVSARPAWTWTADPLAYGRNLSWSDPSASPGFMPYELSGDDCDDFAAWASLVERGWKPRTDVAVSRLLKAAGSRTDAADRLVDAVVAWENLFGTSQGEPRLRISSAMAWLLATDPQSREKLQARLKSLYDDRSRIVHGAHFDETQAAQRGNEAVEFARSALKALLRDRPDVLALPDGAARSTRLILGG